jgi:hypothetical protein
MGRIARLLRGASLLVEVRIALVPRLALCATKSHSAARNQPSAVLRPAVLSWDGPAARLFQKSAQPLRAASGLMASLLRDGAGGIGYHWSL